MQIQRKDICTHYLEQWYELLAENDVEKINEQRPGEYFGAAARVAK